MYLSENENSQLAKEKEINETVLDKYIEVLHGDNIVPNISATYQKKNALSLIIPLGIFTSEREVGSISSRLVETLYVWVKSSAKGDIEALWPCAESLSYSKRPIGRSYLSEQLPP